MLVSSACRTRVRSAESTAMLAACRPARFTSPNVTPKLSSYTRHIALGADAGAKTWPTGEGPTDANPPPSDNSQPKPFMAKARAWILGGRLDKERLKSLGLGAFLAYGFVSNVTYGACFTIGWASHVAATGMTPFGGGQFGPFLGRVAGLLALQQLLRPIRFSCAIALTPFVDRLLGALQRRMGFPRNIAFFCLFAALAVLTFAGYGVALTAVTVWNMPK